MNNDSQKKPTLKITDDGSHTLYSGRFNQHYHNPNGAVTESKHVFFKQSGLIKAIKDDQAISILEIGFGTGLNLLLLMDYLLQYDSSAEITFHSIEAWPISGETATSLNYGNYLAQPELAETLPRLFNSLKQGENKIGMFPPYNIAIFCGLFQEYTPEEIRFDYIFHDAFSPAVNADLWTGEAFLKLLQWSNSRAVLSTYCAASKARGAMAWAGWKVAKAPGAPGKREMTVASPTAEPLQHLKRVNEERLARRYEEGDF